MMRKYVRAAGAVAVGALALASCGTVSKVTTAHAVSNSLSRLGSQSAIGLAISLPLSSGQIQQLAGSSSGMPAAAAKAISSGSIFFDEQSGNGEALDSKQVQSDPQNRYDIGLQIGSTVPVELRYVGQNLYIRVQVSQLVSDVGEPASFVTSFDADLQQISTYVPGITALGAGQWVEVTHASLQSVEALFKSYMAELGATSPTTVSKAQSQTSLTKLRTDLITAVKNNTTYANLGTAGGHTEYQLKVSVKPLIEQIGTVLTQDLAGLSYGSLASKELGPDISKAEAKIPAGQTAIADLYVKNDKAQEIDVDLNQFIHKYSFAIPLRMVLSTPATISAPSGATTLDLSKLPSLISGILGNLGKSSISSG